VGRGRGRGRSTKYSTPPARIILDTKGGGKGSKEKGEEGDQRDMPSPAAASEQAAPHLLRAQQHVGRLAAPAGRAFPLQIVYTYCTVLN